MSPKLSINNIKYQSAQDYQCTQLSVFRNRFATFYNFTKSIYFYRLSPFTRLVDSDW